MARRSRVPRRFGPRALLVVGPALVLGAAAICLESIGGAGAVSLATEPASVEVAAGADPTAANADLTIDVEVSPPRPRVGEPVTVRVVASDPDAPVSTNCGTWYFADPHATRTDIGYPCVLERHAGAPVAVAQAGTVTETFSHVFTRPGTFAFVFGARSGHPSSPGDAAASPFASTAESSVDIVVEAAGTS